MNTPNYVWLTKTHTTYETNPLAAHLPTWSRFDTLTAQMNYKWDAGSEWLDDYTYYAEVIGDDDDDWWGFGMTTPSDGDADVPQPKVYRSYARSANTMLHFHQRVPEYAAAMERDPSYVPQTKFGWAVDDGSGNQVFGRAVDGYDAPVRRRKFGKVLRLKEAGLLAEFNLLPNNVPRDEVYTSSFDAKYFEPTFDSKPYMASFHPLRDVNDGEVFHTIDRPILTQATLDFCADVAADFFEVR